MQPNPNLDLASIPPAMEPGTALRPRIKAPLLDTIKICMSLLDKPSFPALAASSALHQTAFTNRDHHIAERNRHPPAARARGVLEFFPAVLNPTLAAALSRIAAAQRYKLVGYRLMGLYPSSTGTSQIGYACLTNHSVACPIVIMIGLSADKKSANGRVFHLARSNTEYKETLAQYKACLQHNELDDMIVILAGCAVNPDAFTAISSSNGRREAAAESRQHIDELREFMGDEELPILQDDAGENRPAYVNMNSNIGFEFYKKEYDPEHPELEGTIGVLYHSNAHIERIV